jgi:hypothetical protein
MSNMIIDVKFLPGTTIENALREAKEMANKLDVAYIKFKFNDTSISIGRNADLEKALLEYKYPISNMKIIVEA